MASILDSIAMKPSAKASTNKMATPNQHGSILDGFGSPQKKRQMQQTSQIGSELSRLEQLQVSLSHQMDLFPVKQEKPGSQANRAKPAARVQKLIQKQANSQGTGAHFQQETRSILESDLFKKREDERERMIKMYTNEELRKEMSERDSGTRGDASLDAQSNNSSINDRMMETKAKKNDNSEVDFDLTKTGGKNVSFARDTKQAVINQLSEAAVSGGVDDVKEQLAMIRQRTLEVQGGVTDGFAVEDSNLLEAIMEHILVHWDDIMACLVDELIEEEVLELNRIDKIRSGKDPEQEARDELIDMLFEKKRHYTLIAPELGIKCKQQL